MKHSSRTSHLFSRNYWMSAALAGIIVAAGCGGGDSGPQPVPTATTTATPAVTAKPTATVPSPATSKIVFSSLRDGNAEIYIMNADGSRQTRLTNSPSQDTEPSLSGDRNKIAFVSDRDGTPHIYTLRLNDGALRRLTGGSLRDAHPSFSRDGRKIVYERDGSIALANADGTANTVVLPKGETRYSNPSISLDGRKIVFNAISTIPIPNDQPAIFTVDSNGANRKYLTGGAFETSLNPVFSPDGQTIAFSRGSIYLINLDGSNERQLGESTQMGAESPTFSPDGRQIAFAGIPFNSSGDSLERDREIYRIDLNGTNLTRLTSNRSVDTSPNWK